MQLKAAIIGRPNVGKSALFNCLTRTRSALVHHIPGTTRDRKESTVQSSFGKFILADTGGWAYDDNIFSAPIKEQMHKAVKMADVVLLVVDGKDGYHPLDKDLANFLRQENKKTILVINKIDSLKLEFSSADFYGLGIEDTISISAAHGRNIPELLDLIARNIEPQSKTDVDLQEEEKIKIILLGKPNVGKSSLLNKLSREERVIVDTKPGTTAEAIDTIIEFNGEKFIIIDTPGLHRKRIFKSDMDYLSALSAKHAMEQADVAVLVLDATQIIGETEIKIANKILENNLSCIIAMNKWDLIEEKEFEVKRVMADIEQKLKFLWWSKLIFISAKTGLRTEKMLSEIKMVYKEYTRTFPQDMLKEFTRSFLQSKPWIRQGKIAKFNKITQGGTKPPFFVVSVSDPSLLHFSQKRRIENALRKYLGIYGTPIKLIYK